MFGNLTVYETLMYAAKFQLPASVPNQEKHKIVMDLLKEFGLDGVKDTIIGTPLLKGCSGGQVRRVSVASQVIGLEGGILFLDEPTSGLDSVAANSVITSVRRLAENQKATVIATIHQPSTETFELFSHVLILGQGQTVYYGPRDQAIEYFASIGHEIPVRSNPSDVYLQLTNTDFDMEKTQGKERVAGLAEKFKNSELAASIATKIKDSKANASSYIKGSLGYTNSFTHQTGVLMSRALLNATKNPLAYWVRVLMYVGLAVLMGTTWLSMSTDQDTIADRMAAMFFSVAFLSFMAVAGIPAFLEERHVYVRERDNGLYGVESYVISNFLISIPFVFMITLSFALVAYFAMGLQATAAKFFIFVGYLFLALMIAEAQTVFVSVAIPIFVAALAITAFTNGLWMVVQGFFVRRSNMPNFWRYSFHQIDFQKYAFELLLTNELTGLNFSCGDSCACMYPSSSNTPCSFTGKDVLNNFEYTDVVYWKWTVIMVAILAFFKLATYAVLKVGASKKN